MSLIRRILNLQHRKELDAEIQSELERAQQFFHWCRHSCFVRCRIQTRADWWWFGSSCGCLALIDSRHRSEISSIIKMRIECSTTWEQLKTRTSYCVPVTIPRE